MAKDPFEVAKELKSHEKAHGVRVCERSIEVAHAPEEKFVEKIPEDLHEHIMSVIDGTVWQPEYKNAGRDAEHHSWSGGRSHDPVLSSYQHEAGYELKYLLAK